MKYKCDRTHERYSERLVKRHGNGIIKDLNLLKDDNRITLKWLGEKYHFSKENARLIFNRFFGIDYSLFFKAKRSSRAKQRFDSMHDPEQKTMNYKKGYSNVYRGVVIEALVVGFCKSLGYEITIQKGVSIRCVDLIVNKLKCDVKASYKPWKQKAAGHNAYYRFHVSEKQLQICDFIICYVVPKKDLYIIPVSYLSRRMIYLPVADAEHRYSIYKNAWHLLSI